LSKTRTHSISMAVVEAAYEDVRENKGAPGVDKETIAEFDKNSDDNLYKIWNRMSSGSYFPAPVRTVEIPKSDGKSLRKLGIPTVSDRVAQTVAVRYLEPLVEPIFHKDSYGFRPGRAQKDALEATVPRCWKFDWVIDLDIKAFFDTLDHQLLLDAVREHTDLAWLLLYIERWLKAPMQDANGNLCARDKGTPQGGAISPLLANIYLHHAFDAWMEAIYPYIPFARFADDIVVHCKTKAQADYILSQIAKRLQAWKLELHPEKTRIVYCKDGSRTGNHTHEEFDFLGFTFRTRRAISRDGRLFRGFVPVMSRKAKKRIRGEMRQWKMQTRTDLSIKQLADMCNQSVRSWYNYYGMFYRGEVVRCFFPVNLTLLKWTRRKYQKNARDAWAWLRRLCKREPDLFVHWTFGLAIS
jgi:RNA-directed DNA polymerase